MNAIPRIPTTSLSLEYDRMRDGTEVSTAVVEFEDGVSLRFRFADHVLSVSEVTGVERELTALAHPASGVESLETTTPRLELPETWYTQWSADVYGVVTDVAVDPIPGADEPFDVLDVGPGTCYLHPSVRERLPRADRPLTVGDALYVPTTALEIGDLHP